MKENEKKWLSNYKSPTKGKKKGKLSTREIIKMQQERIQEVRVFLRALSQQRRTERKPYEEPIEATS